MSRNYSFDRAAGFQDRFWGRTSSLPELAWEDRIRLPSAFAIRQMTAMDFLNLPHKPYPKVDS